eukprot:SM000155S01656  [mRNA]  locus=s155:173564:182998:- [translate_table: standard]
MAVAKGQVDLLDCISWLSVECLNEKPDRTHVNALKQGYREDDGLTLESDADEQLLLYLPFNQMVKLHSLIVKGPASQGPRKLKLYANRESMGFRLSLSLLLGSDTGDMPAQDELDLTVQQIEEAMPIPLKYVKFQNVRSLTIFVESNQDDAECTSIQKIVLLGSTQEPAIELLLHPAAEALPRLCARYSGLAAVAIDYGGWSSADGPQVDDAGLLTVATYCRNLQEVSLSYCVYVTDAGVAHLSSCPLLATLRLNFMPGVSGRGLLSVVSRCRALLRLHIEQCMSVRSAEWLEFLGRNRRSLRQLGMVRCRGLGEDDLARLGRGWEELEELDYALDAYMRSVCVPSVLRLDCGRTNAGESTLQTIAHCPHLLQLHLSNFLAASPHIFQLVVSSELTELRILGLRHSSLCPPAHVAWEEALLELASRCQQLAVVELKADRSDSTLVLLTFLCAADGWGSFEQYFLEVEQFQVLPLRVEGSFFAQMKAMCPDLHVLHIDDHSKICFIHAVYAGLDSVVNQGCMTHVQDMQTSTHRAPSAVEVTADRCMWGGRAEGGGAKVEMHLAANVVEASPRNAQDDSRVEQSELRTQVKVLYESLALKNAWGCQHKASDPRR